MESLDFIGQTRQLPRQGDVFALKLKNGKWLFGRVAFSTPPISPWGDWEEGVVLIYLYDIQHDNPTPPQIFKLTSLLLPPLIVIDEPWQEGYVLPLENRGFEPGERYKRHCFRSQSVLRMCDDQGRVVTEQFEPVVDLDMYSLSGLDELVSAAIKAGR